MGRISDYDGYDTWLANMVQQHFDEEEEREIAYNAAQVALGICPFCASGLTVAEIEQGVCNHCESSLAAPSNATGKGQ